MIGLEHSCCELEKKEDSWLSVIKISDAEIRKGLQWFVIRSVVCMGVNQWGIIEDKDTKITENVTVVLEIG